MFQYKLRSHQTGVKMVSIVMEFLFQKVKRKLVRLFAGVISLNIPVKQMEQHHIGQNLVVCVRLE
jgi:hypothetical protein